MSESRSQSNVHLRMREHFWRDMNSVSKVKGMGRKEWPKTVEAGTSQGLPCFHPRERWKSAAQALHWKQRKEYVASGKNLKIYEVRTKE